MKLKLTSLFFFIAFSTLLHAQSYEARWSQIEKAEKKNLPQTVINLADGVFNKAESEHNSPQMLKAYLWKMRYQQLHVPDSFYTCLKKLEQWSGETNVAMDQAILHSLLAQMYADYVARNSWELRKRTNLASGDSLKDIREWSTNLFVAKVVKHTQAALRDSSLLLNTSSALYDPLVEQADESAYYHHDMYHLLVSRGVAALNSVRSFGDDTLIKNIISILYRNMIHSYKERENADAVLLASLDSLKWSWNARNISFLQAPVTENAFKSSPFIIALDNMILAAKERDICAEAYLVKAEQARDEGLNVLALQFCDRAISSYHGYRRINALKNLRTEIRHPSLNIDISQFIYPHSAMELHVTHVNLKGFTAEIYQVDWAANALDLDIDKNDKAFYKKYCKKVRSQHFSLLSSPEYLEKDTIVKLLSPAEGLYLLKVVPDVKTKSMESRFLYSTRFKILSCVLPEGQQEYITLDAKTGHPIPHAILRFYANERGLKVEKKAFTTDSQGRLKLLWQKKYRYLKAEKGKDKAMPIRSIYAGNYSYTTGRDKLETEVKLLTDRSVYRPGQTVYVKGIAYDLLADTAAVVSGKEYRLTLSGSNGQEIGSKKVCTNDFGSFTAEFVLPVSSLNGIYSLKTKGGWKHINVEAYKRPTFNVSFLAQEESYQLGDSLQVKGMVQTYAKVPLQGALAKYVVTRSTGIWERFNNRELITLASGEIKVKEDGTFVVPLLLQDYRTEEETQKFYTYTLEVSVTSSSGETQKSETSFRVGDRSLLLASTLSEKICKDDTIQTTFEARNLNNQLMAIKGKYILYAYTDRKATVVSKHSVLSGSFVSNKKVVLSTWRTLSSGIYKLVLKAKDEQGREVTSEQDLVLFSMSDSRPPKKSPIWYYAARTSIDKTHPASFIFGTSEQDTYVMMDVFSGDKRLKTTILNLSDSVKRFDIPYKAEYGDGLKIIFAFVKRGELYQQDIYLPKTIADKQLKVKWNVFRDRLSPGQKEEWKLTLQTPQGTSAEAEMLATMYDASLDKIWGEDQLFFFNYLRQLPTVSWRQYYRDNTSYYWTFNANRQKVPSLSYDSFMDVEVNKMYLTGSTRVRGIALAKGEPVFEEEMLPVNSVSLENKAENVSVAQDGISLQEPAFRTNFAETAFFYPQLHTNDKGKIVFSFTMPESLTTWNFRGYAHTKGMLTTMIEKKIVASKDFMLTPNLPRFVRVGDKTSVAASISNLTKEAVSGGVSLVLFDPITEQVISTQKEIFTVDAGKTTTAKFFFVVPDNYDLLGCRLLAAGDSFSDGEQHILPVLSDKELLTEAIAMPVRGNETHDFSMKSLFNHQSKSAVDKKLTIEFTSNPAWYAVQALPALSFPTTENAISWAGMYYANSLASYIMNAQPKLKAIFDSWKLEGGDKTTFISNLQKNQEIKNILLEESPWLMDAKSEAEQRERIGVLFDLNNIQNKKIVALAKLKELQLYDGSWSWYAGMNGNRYITNFVLETLVRLARLTNEPLDGATLKMQQAAFDYLHVEALKEYNVIRKTERRDSKQFVLSASALEYLYLIALSDEKVPAKNEMAYTYFLNKVSTLLASSDFVEKAHAAIVLHHAGRSAEAQAFMVSIKEYAVQSEEMGMYFALNENSYVWSKMKVPTHVAAMEAFDIVSHDTHSIEEMKLWLLKQKQTQQWTSPIATVDAVYALLHRSSDLLNNADGLKIQFGSELVVSHQNIQGLGYVKKAISDMSLIENLPDIKITKPDKGIAWGAVYAQYREDLDKVRQQGKELAVEKNIYVERIVNSKAQLYLLMPGSTLSVGDKVVVRLTLHLDRPMNFVQLKDERASCFEPVNSASGYRWSSGLGYYIDVKDASTNFFFDTLQKGIYVLESQYKVDRDGVYESGLATIQSAYASEYSSHSNSNKIEVRN